MFACSTRAAATKRLRGRAHTRSNIAAVLRRQSRGQAHMQHPGRGRKGPHGATAPGTLKTSAQAASARPASRDAPAAASRVHVRQAR